VSKDKEKDKTDAPDKPDTQVSVGDWVERKEPRFRNFPGPPGARALLRVACERTAYADLIGHAKENLKTEVCGVLAGEACEDDNGPFVLVKASVRGSAAKQGSAHVTFTHDTWNAIHLTMEKSYPKLQIVGWYHTHPGFGVEFSDMDEFCHKNFFPGPQQVALVTDPLSGDVAIAANYDGQFRYVERFWIDAREHQCRLPASMTEDLNAGATGAGSGGGGGVSRRELQELETRLNQVLEAVNEQRSMFYKFLFTLGLLFCIGFVYIVTNTIWSNYKNRNEQPQMISMAPVPVKIDGKDVLLGVGVVKWQIPPELDALMIEKVKEEVALKAALDKALADKEKAEQEKAAKEAKDGTAKPDDKKAPDTK
jgi:proteasome lid subunit RPN8/RPN11